MISTPSTAASNTALMIIHPNPYRRLHLIRRPKYVPPAWLITDLQDAGLFRTIELVQHVALHPGAKINLKVMPELPNDECVGGLSRVMRETGASIYYNGFVYYG